MPDKKPTTYDDGLANRFSEYVKKREEKAGKKERNPDSGASADPGIPNEFKTYDFSKLENTLYIPQQKKIITAREVMKDAKYPTLAQHLELILKNPVVARYYIANRDEGAWMRTCVYYDMDADGNDKLAWINGPIEIIDAKHYNLLQGAKTGKIDLPDTGWVMAYKESGKWIIWNTDPNSKEYNGGFARKTAPNTDAGKFQAEQSFVNVWEDRQLFQGLTEQEVKNMVSIQWRL
ncbi:MAG: hypothetical protein HZB65_03035 [Candidatus Aenigmarchaeota archaeon]|nr:hypothetical protein [Candidatus Aenigmarchaeota archaeon]